MTKRFAFMFTVVALLLSLTAVTFGQETTGTIEVTAKDPNGAVVPNVSVTIASSNTDRSSTAGYKRTVTTDEGGFVRVLQIPPGFYSVTAAATAGFQERIVPNVKVDLGKVTPVNLELSTTVGGIVTVTDEAVLPIDPTSTKIETTISAQQAELLPKGTNFSSLLKVSPSTRPEPLSGQFQIDGASGSENVFVVDGQEVTNARTGVLNTNSNLPFQLVQEIQVKTSAFEAEYGGATGGVVSAVTKGGGNEFRGEFGLQFRPKRLEPVGRNALILNSNGDAEYIPSGRDGGLGFFPAATLGGPIIKDRVWFFAGYVPQIFTTNRTVRYVNPTTRAFLSEEAYKQKITNQYAFLRIDAQPFSKLRVNAAYTYNPIIQEGTLAPYSEGVTAGAIPSGNGLSGDEFYNQTGGRQNAQQVTGQATWTPTSNLVLNFRAGHYFLNEKLGTYGFGDVTVPRVLCSGVSPSQFPGGFGCVRGQSNGITAINNTLFDATTRNTFDADATFITSLFGRHEFKGGYQYNGLSNKLLSQDTDQIILRYGQTIASYSGNPVQSTPGALGAGSLIRFAEQGDVSSKNEGIFIQDKWQPFSRLTLNLGFRTERENVPSFNPQLDGIKFNFQDKIAPRLGGAFDLTGDGKTKISVFYGWFYDRFKYELPRGSFGGQFYRQDFFEILPGDTRDTFTVGTILGGNPGNQVGGNCPSTGVIYGRVRCQLDFRVPSNSGLGVEFGSVDPDIQAFRQSEFSATFERDLGSDFVIRSRYARKNVDRAIEDAGFLLPTGSESYIIGNPGRGLHRQLLEAQGLVPLEPKRQYDALEVTLEKRFAKNYYFNANYTLSRLYGNYSGLASSDEEGRLSPNVNRFFDLPFAGFTGAGGPDDGRLPTDRPHAFKFYGAYSLDWNSVFNFGQNNSTDFALFTTLQSGTPITTQVDIQNIDTIVLTERGDLGRTEMFTETDFAIRHRYRFGRDNRFSVVFDLDVLNLFNEANETNRYNLISSFNVNLVTDVGLLTAAEQAQANALQLAFGRFQRNGALSALQNIVNAPENFDDRFNRSNAFQAPRQVRFGFRFLF